MKIYRVLVEWVVNGYSELELQAVDSLEAEERAYEAIEHDIWEDVELVGGQEPPVDLEPEVVRVEIEEVE